MVIFEVIKPIVKPIVEKPYDAWLGIDNLVVQFSMWLNKEKNGSKSWIVFLHVKENEVL